MTKGYIIDMIKGTDVRKITAALRATPEIKKFVLDENAWLLIVESERNVDTLVRYAVENIGKSTLRTRLSKRELKMVQDHLGRRLTQNPPKGWEVSNY